LIARKPSARQTGKGAARQRRCSAQYPLGSKIVLLAKYSAISGSGKSLHSIGLL
jgi:hypothetical protein